jgi:ABC-type amino acid transport substrate-binding protein
MLPSVRTTTPFRAAIIGLLTLTLAGCGVTIPSDPDGTLEQVRDGVLRAGVSPHGEFVMVEPGASTPTGSEVEAIEAFADSIGAEVEWTVSSEEALVRGLEAGTLDLVAAGLTEATPWIDKAGVTRPYAETTSTDGSPQKLVMLVPLGENAFLTELETFLTEYEAAL